MYLFNTTAASMALLPVTNGDDTDISPQGIQGQPVSVNMANFKTAETAPA